MDWFPRNGKGAADDNRAVIRKNQILLLLLLKDIRQGGPVDQHALSQNIWIILASWSSAYLGDHFFTIYNAKLFHNPAGRQISVQGSLELTPQAQEDIDHYR